MSTHRCYACDPLNADRIFDGAGSVRVPARFAGPPGTANGGIAVGSLACPALRATHQNRDGHPAVTRITARLHRGLPLETPASVSVASSDGAYEIALPGESPLVTGIVETRDVKSPVRPGGVIGEAPPDAAEHLRELARVAVPDRPPFFEETGDHPIPGCFSCGPENARGLHIYPRVAGYGLVCAPWRPSPEFDDGGGALATLVLSSALDCSSGICMPVEMQRELLALDQFFLLGSMELRFLRVPEVGGDYRVAAKALGRDGRKFFGMSALFDGSGTPYAMAQSTWIIAGVPRSDALGGS